MAAAAVISTGLGGDGLPESRIFDELWPETCSPCLTSTASGTSTPNTLPCKCRESHRPQAWHGGPNWQSVLQASLVGTEIAARVASEFGRQRKAD
jgi:hypothetical protein